MRVDDARVDGDFVNQQRALGDDDFVVAGVVGIGRHEREFVAGSGEGELDGRVGEGVSVLVQEGDVEVVAELEFLAAGDEGFSRFDVLLYVV